MMIPEENSFRSAGCMGTWNGHWLHQDPEMKRFLEEHEVDEDCVPHFRELTCFRALVARFEEFLLQRVEKLGFKHWSYCVELSLKSEDNGRLHFHAYWQSKEAREDKRVFVGLPNAWNFEGATPFLKPNTAKGRHAERFCNRGHYYCQCNKTGVVLSKTNYHKHTDYIVEQKWVMQLWMVRKLSHSVAIAEIINARGHTSGYLKEIRTIEELEEKIAIEQEKRLIDALLSGTMKPFKWYPEIELWRLQYDREHPMGMWGKTNRFKFLVLTGPSCLGKTQFAKSLFGTDSTMVVPCQGVKSPDLHEYRRSQHKCILFDEVSSKCIEENKAVFQANNDVVLLGQSPTGDYVYRRFLYGTAMICCTNTWMEGIERGSSAEEWLLTNSIVYHCTEKLYLE